MDKESRAYKSGEFDDMFNEAEINNMVAEDIVAYENSYLRYEENLAAVEYASIKSREEGREEGRMEGREEGREEERVMIAKRLLSTGMPVEMIVNVTGISPELLN